jgi:hypothetical protein
MIGVMVDNTNLKMEIITMQKFTFVVDIVTDSPVAVDVAAVRGTLLASVDGIGNIAAVHPVKIETLKEQGFKVWRARVAGVKEPKKVKPPKAAKVEQETVSAS